LGGGIIEEIVFTQRVGDGSGTHCLIRKVAKTLFTFKTTLGKCI